MDWIFMLIGSIDRLSPVVWRKKPVDPIVDQESMLIKWRWIQIRLSIWCWSAFPTTLHLFLCWWCMSVFWRCLNNFFINYVAGEDYILQYMPPAQRLELLQAESCPDTITNHVASFVSPQGWPKHQTQKSNPLGILLPTKKKTLIFSLHPFSCYFRPAQNNSCLDCTD